MIWSIKSPVNNKARLIPAVLKIPVPSWLWSWSWSCPCAWLSCTWWSWSSQQSGAALPTDPWRFASVLIFCSSVQHSCRPSESYMCWCSINKLSVFQRNIGNKDKKRDLSLKKNADDADEYDKVRIYFVGGKVVTQRYAKVYEAISIVCITNCTKPKKKRLSK